MFERLCKLIGKPVEMAAKLPTQKARIGAVAEMDPAIESWTERFTTAECVEKLLAVGVAGGPIAPVEDYPREANLDFRGMIGRAFDPVSKRELFVPVSPLRMSRTPGLLPTRIPAPDADRAEVIKIAARLPDTALNASPARRSLDKYAGSSRSANTPPRRPAPANSARSRGGGDSRSNSRPAPNRAPAPNRSTAFRCRSA